MKIDWNEQIEKWAELAKSPSGNNDVLPHMMVPLCSIAGSLEKLAGRGPYRCSGCKGSGRVSIGITSTTCSRCGGKGHLYPEQESK